MTFKFRVISILPKLTSLRLPTAWFVNFKKWCFTFLSNHFANKQNTFHIFLLSSSASPLILYLLTSHWWSLRIYVARRRWWTTLTPYQATVCFKRDIYIHWSAYWVDPYNSQPAAIKVLEAKHRYMVRTSHWKGLDF